MFFGGDFGLKLKLNITNGIIGQLMQLMSETSLDSNLTGFVLANYRSNLSIESYEIKIYCRGVFKKYSWNPNDNFFHPKVISCWIGFNVPPID